MTTNNNIDQLRKRIHILNSVVVIGFFVIGVGLIYWSAIQAENILTRDDNPRLVDEETAIQRGKILSTNGSVLAETSEIDGISERIYRADSGGPVLGYYSIRYGISGIEESLDGILRGDSDEKWSDYFNYELLHNPRIGRDVRLTIDERWQRASDKLLDDKKGAVLLLSLPDFGIRALSSQPDYDPNILDEKFDDLSADEDAPLLNRVSQGQYRPGMAIQPFIITYALEQGLIDESDLVLDIELSVPINGVQTGCKSEDFQDGSWADVLQGTCPGPMITLGDELGLGDIEDALEMFYLKRAPVTELAVAPGAPDDFKLTDPGFAAIGQDAYRVSPLQVGLAWASLANEGEIKDVKLVESIQEEDGSWRATDQTSSGEQIVSQDSAELIREMLPVHRGVTEHSVLVSSGPESRIDAWYLALAPASDPLYAVVVVLEDSSDLADAEQIGRSLIRNVLNPSDS